MQRCLLWAPLAILGCWTPQATAAEEPPLSPQAAQFAPAPPGPPVYHDMTLTRHAYVPVIGQDPTVRRPILECWQKQGYHCAASHNSSGCTNFYSDFVFVFGSCRQFFSEPCFATPQAGYGAVPLGTGNGCGCRQ